MDATRKTPGLWTEMSAAFPERSPPPPAPILDLVPRAVGQQPCTRTSLGPQVFPEGQPLLGTRVIHVGSVWPAPGRSPALLAGHLASAL